MSKVFNATYIETPRHGYLKVKGDDVREVNISQSFSEYSFYDGDEDIFFLEEDCDMPMFLKRCELDEVKVEIEDDYLDSEDEANQIRCHETAEGGDYGYFGELKQNTDGLEEFFSDYYNDEDDDEDDDGEEEN